MRRCAVNNCPNSDLTVLCHRFPKSRNSAQIWQINLNLEHFPLDVLISKYTICFMHFNSTDYRNSSSNSLNLNAIPQLNPNNPRKDASKDKKTKVVLQQQHSPTHWPQIVDKQAPESSVNVSDSIELLHDDTDEATEVDDNLVCTPCDSDDICILPEEQNAADDLIQSIDGAGFTLLDATSYGFMNDSRNFEVSELSTDLKLGSETDSGHSHDFPPDGTDSDVEVLVSESIFESQWSETDCSAMVLRADQTSTTDSAVSECVSSKSKLSTKINEDPEYGQLDKKELIEIIKKQSTNIQQLEQKLELFKSAQKTLIGQFKAFRETVGDENSI